MVIVLSSSLTSYQCLKQQKTEGEMFLLAFSFNFLGHKF
jgi:hypothetical protein